MIGTTASTGLLIATLIALTIHKKNELTALAQYEEQLAQEVTELDMLLGQKKLLEDLEQHLYKRLHKIQKVTCTSKNSPYPYLNLIERIIPDRVIISQFTFGPTAIKLEGYAYTTKEVSLFMRALANAKIVQRPKLRTLNRRLPTDTKKITTTAMEQEPGTVHFIIDVKKS